MSDVSKIPVVYYHSIGPAIPTWYRNFLTLSPERFREHLEYFRSNYTIISLKELWMIMNGQSASVRKPLVITFDDGYSDNYTWAFPVLKKYEVKATIFVSPDFADDREIERTGPDDRGFLSWKEMRLMEGSGLVDIQSHTLTHTKYFVSDRLTGFHHPGGDILYQAGNVFPDKRKDSVSDPSFERLLPYGYPLFEEGSAVTSRRVFINHEFTEQCVSRLKDYDFGSYKYEDAFKLIAPLYDSLRKSGRLITATESGDEYTERVRNEILGSKRIIEERLNKTVEFLCWPHGDNNESLHRMALEAGYLMTTRGKARGGKEPDCSRIPERMGVDFSTWSRKQKTKLRLRAFSGENPYDLFMSISRRFRKER